ncbi:MAG: chromosome segregation protein SMC [Candidatus Omnitrophica bacterium]|nr:chromosome segregation protein SMC [Candidatus Omnitrophota bacterium]
MFKSLELSGFKSFAEKTTLVFEPGVTAIVGPNGSGKSNIADSIKWVLGEQSARELRGGHMEDLIFNGTDGRPPLNAAEVSLTFDNAAKRLPTEYAEVMITRRLYRSGESEYLLNKTPVRLKDITELLMGTGIGTSAYSLFEQGKMDQLIQARPEERRAIFEEAAGITKFKTQKREALRKLEQTEANLLRLADVIGEVRRQLQALERQVRKAQLYRDQWERLKTLEALLARRDSRRLQDQRQSLEQAQAGLRAEESQRQQAAREAESALERRRDALEAVDRRHAEAQAQALAVAHAVEMARRQIQTHQERLVEDARRREVAGREIETLRQQMTQTETHVAALRHALEATEAEREGFHAALAAAQQQIAECEEAIRRAQATLQARRGAVVEAAARAARLRNELLKTSTHGHAAHARVQRLELEAGRVAQEQAALAPQAATLEQTLAERHRQAAQEESARQSQQAAWAQAQAQADASARAITEAQQALVALHSRHEILQGLLTSHGGVSLGVKALLEGLQKEAIPRDGVLGLLVDALRVEPGYEAAVEAALGDWADALVVEQWETAARLLTCLQTTREGRATLLLRGASLPSAEGGGPPRPAGPYEPILTKVHVEAAWQPLVERLLEHTYIAPDLPTALEFQRAAIVPVRFVTRQGERVTATSLTGGSAWSADQVLVGRPQRVVQLAAELAAAAERVERAQQQAAAAAAQAQAIQAAIAQQDQQAQTQREALSQTQHQRDTVRQALRKLDEERALLQTELAEARQSLAEAQARDTSARDAVACAEQALEEDQQAIAAAQAQRDAAARDRERHVTAQAQAQAQLASVDQVRAGRQQSLDLLTQSRDGMTQTLAAREQELVALAERAHTLTSACVVLEQEVTAHAQRRSSDDQTVQQIAAERATLAAAIAQEQAQGHEQAVALEAVRQRLHEQEMAITQLTYQQQALTDRLRERYQLELDWGQTPSATPPPEPDWPAITREVETLRRKLEGLGPVSLASLDESRELQERLTFLTNQQADLQNAKDDLHQAITTINRTTRIQFKETFQHIQQEFQVTFKTLFGGGEARLVLLDEEDLLESGIEIIARPPGKTAQAISLLSGGEKALTSIALLFAIFRIKPSPFCVLDEIDAPLDEANIDRFTRALKEFLQHSQFIIITHNKKTITMADVMYGITMEEQGISKIVSVKFSDREPTSAPAAGSGSI